MLYPNPKPSRATLSAIFSAPMFYKIITICLALSLSLYALVWWSEVEIRPAGWQHDNVSTTERPEVPVDQDRRFALIVPSTNPSPNLCRTVFSAMALGYPSPVIINWGLNYRDISHWRLGKNLPKIVGFVNYLDSVMHPSAAAEEKLFDDDIVLMVDAYDVWFQLPAQVLLSRYHEINRKANERLRKEWKRKDIPMPMKQTIVAASQRKCYPEDPVKFGVDMKCDRWPEPPLREDLYGPETEKNATFWHNNRPRWINGGMYIGPAGDMRRLFRRAKQNIERMVAEAFPIRSEQGMIGEVLGAQEVWRELQRQNHVSVDVEDFVGENFEFHIGLDYAQDISAQAFATEIRPEDDLFDGDFVMLSDQASIEKNSEVRGISPVRVEGIPDDLKSVQSPLVEQGKAVDWSDMRLYTDFFLTTVPAILHHNKFKERRETWWDRPWYHQKLRGLVKSALLPRKGNEPLATVQLEGSKVRYWAASAEKKDRYPRMAAIFHCFVRVHFVIDIGRILGLRDFHCNWLNELRIRPSQRLKNRVFGQANFYQDTRSHPLNDTTTALTAGALSVETTTAVATTTTSEEAGPTGFFLVPGEGPALEGQGESNGDSFTPMVLCDCGSTFNSARFLVDEITGELQYLQVGLPYALITRCESHNLYYGSVPLNCASIRGPGTSVGCSAAKLDYQTTGSGSSQACSRSQDPDWGALFITNSDV
ncbi:uncharacterized protein FSUBG_3881 [Fusarium subglutinans]|uniref:Uncharacterized protein n=1 Tax=Gibberella subglutinans TaxID=42677 RepID=A0A8H5Q7H8_GIBSU|nr:uncharacterized protein FSUBG_3881 [Fusarium subglutinans]KAF5609674.1 hypothetical protein FSUBG_3881 [Fusarium subglutinans]